MVRRHRTAAASLFTDASDLPLFSGTAPRAQVQTFNPNEQAQQPQLLAVTVDLADLWRARLAKTRRSWDQVTETEAELLLAPDPLDLDTDRIEDAAAVLFTREK